MDKAVSVNVIGCGLAGLSAALTLAKNGVFCNLISSQPAARAQSVLAEGGINAALDTMGEGDTVAAHYEDTMKGGCCLASPDAVRALTENAPDIVGELVKLGVPFNSEDGRLILRNFGGQKKKRTAYAKSSTGKVIMTALADEVRKYEAKGLVKRFDHHDLVSFDIKDGALRSVKIHDRYENKFYNVSGSTVLCTGGMNGLFRGMTTGTTQNSGIAAAAAFASGASLSGLEFIQYHPTTVAIADKRMLISEAARGEGGRLYIMKNGARWYFMEEKYPTLGNLMPRDVVSREMVFAKNEPGCEGDVYLDMTVIDKTVWQNKLSDLRAELIEYLHTDPAAEPVAVSPGIHFFMGGLHVDDSHRTNIKRLYAAGEAACIYHGANRLGGNSMLAAIYGGKTAAMSCISSAASADITPTDGAAELLTNARIRSQLSDILIKSLGIVRDQPQLEKAGLMLDQLYKEASAETDKNLITLGKATVLCALQRKESRGAHYRSDYGQTADAYKKMSVCTVSNGIITTNLL